MANYTPNYGLHQWVPEDNFLRTDFNEDLAKIDAAIKAAEETAAAGDQEVLEQAQGLANAAQSAAQAAQNTANRALKDLEPVGYNVYNLLLQNYYEGKATGYKKALLFDGFRDKSNISSMTGVVWDATDLSLLLDAVGQQEYSYGYGQGYSNSIKSGQSLSFSWTATGNGILTGVAPCASGQIKLTVSVGGSVVGQHSMTTSQSWPTIPVSVPVTAGTTYDFVLTNLGIDTMGYCATSSSAGLGYKLIFTPTVATSGTIITAAATPGTAAQATAWVRHQPGSVTVAIRQGSGSWYEMTKTGTRSTVNTDGEACTESSFTLSRSLSGSLSLRLSTSTSTGVSMRIYDYGVLFT